MTPLTRPLADRTKTKLGMFDYFSKIYRKRGERFALGMAGCETIKAFTEDVYAFGKLPSNATIIDVGGGLDQVSLYIAGKILGLSSTVQGQARVIEIATSGGIEEEVRDRIAFQAHSFFDE
jgi:sterigmatocystin 8-O-methyltransferase